MPSYEDVPTPGCSSGVRAQVGALVLVDDGSRPPSPGSSTGRGDPARARPPAGAPGKGSAVRAGIDARSRRPRPGPSWSSTPTASTRRTRSPSSSPPPASADLVIGDRFADLASMPLQRRLANRTTRRLFAARRAGTRSATRRTGCGCCAATRSRLFPAAATRPRRRTSGASCARGSASRGCRCRRSMERSGARSERAGTRCAVLWALVRPLEPPSRRLRRSLLRAGFRRPRPIRKCTPRYTRDTATSAASASSGRLSRGWTIPTATAAANAVAA